MGPITDAHKLTYQQNVMLAVQQIRSKLEPGFTFHPGLKGRIANMLELIGSTTAVLDLPRKADTPDIDNQVEPVWCSPRQMVWGKIIEKEDAIKALTDYQSPFVQAGAAAIQRAFDTILRDSVFGSRKIGQDGTTVQAYDNTGKLVTVGIGSADDVTATGMNVKKILRARRLLQAQQVDIGNERMFLATNAQGIEELFRDLTYISADYRNKKVLDEPENLPILNVTVLPPIDGSAAFADFDGTTFRAALWCQSGMHYGDFDPLRTDVPLNPAKLNRPHPQMERWVGATRSEDAKVIEIRNKK